MTIIMRCICRVRSNLKSARAAIWFGRDDFWNRRPFALRIVPYWCWMRILHTDISNWPFVRIRLNKLRTVFLVHLGVYRSTVLALLGKSSLEIMSLDTQQGAEENCFGNT